MVSLFGEFLSELAQTAIRDGLIEMIQKWREPKSFHQQITNVR